MSELSSLDGRASWVREEAEDRRRRELKRLDDRSSLVSEPHTLRSSQSVSPRSLHTTSVTVEGGPYWLVQIGQRQQLSHRREKGRRWRRRRGRGDS